MKVLFIHADSIEFEVKEPAARERDPAARGSKERVEDVLVAFISVESEDVSEPEGIVEEAVGNIIDVADRVKADRVCLYPYAHLSTDLASPSFARKVLDGVAAGLAGRVERVVRAPFGWYKSFTLACKGHPLSELSRDIRPRAKGPAPKGRNRYIILTPDGEELDPRAFEPRGDAFSVLVEKEALGRGRGQTREPRYARLCRKFGFEWEPMSDSGHMRFGPKATLMFDLASAYASQVVMSLGLPVLPVRGTNMFDLREPAVKEHADLFGDRLYTVQHEGRRFVLRYAACHQQFAMIKDWVLSYRHLPFGAFEVADSYRLEQSGECMLGFRVRRLYMPDLHVFCAGMEEARHWFEVLHERIFTEMDGLGRDYEMLINVSSERYYEEAKEWLVGLLKGRGKNALVCIYPGGKNYYWTVNIEYNIIDAENREREIGTVQIDVGNAARFGITYTDENGDERHPVILHTALIGTIERYIYALLDTAVRMEVEGRPGYLPLWINPEMVRILPVADRHLPLAKEMAERLKASGARAGIDDRSESVPRKVREAKQDWVGYVVVVGDREAEAGATLKVYDREVDEERVTTLDELAEEIERKIEGYPRCPMYVPVEMSHRPGV